MLLVQFRPQKVKAVRDLAVDLGSKGFELLCKVVAWHWRRSWAAWESAMNEPALSLRVLYLVVGIVIAFHLVPHAFGELGVTGGISYAAALFVAVSNATFFRVARIGRADFVPLGLVAPIAIFVGVAGSAAARPLLGDAKSAALAEDFAGALIILAIFVVLSHLFGRWRSGNPYR